MGTTQLAEHSVTSSKLGLASVGTSQLTDNSVTTPKVTNASITKPKLSAGGGTAGQLLATDGTNLQWVAAPATVTPINPLGNTITTLDATGAGDLRGPRARHGRHAGRQLRRRDQWHAEGGEVRAMRPARGRSR